MKINNEKETEMELAYCKYRLLKAFPESFINERDEFIAHKRSNTYLCLGNCKKPIDIECKVLEWFSRPASKGMSYSQEWRNKRFRKFMLDGINDFLETDFTENDMEEIYQHFGNAINHEKTVRFVESGYDFEILGGGIEWKSIYQKKNMGITKKTVSE